MQTTRLTIIALVATTIGLAAAAPAFAEDQRPQTPGTHHDFRDGPGMKKFGDFRGPRMRARTGGGLLDVACTDRGAERLEHMFVRISYRLDPTAEQAPLFDALKTAALTAQSEFEATCAAVRPAKEGERPDLMTRLETGLKLDEARVAALSGVLPHFEAFYDSLTDEQKSRLEPGAFARHDMRPDLETEAPADQQG